MFRDKQERSFGKEEPCDRTNVCRPVSHMEQKLLRKRGANGAKVGSGKLSAPPRKLARGERQAVVRDGCCEEEICAAEEEASSEVAERTQWSNGIALIGSGVVHLLPGFLDSLGLPRKGNIGWPGAHEEHEVPRVKRSKDRAASQEPLLRGAGEVRIFNSRLTGS